MAEKATDICSDTATLTDVASLKLFEARESVDYITPMATLTTCRLIDPATAVPQNLLGDATEHLYQLNHIYVVPPTKLDAVKSQYGLFANFDCWDSSKKINLGFRSKAMLQLAQLQVHQTQEYENLLDNDELRHPILSSLRVRIKKKVMTLHLLGQITAKLIAHRTLHPHTRMTSL